MSSGGGLDPHEARAFLQMLETADPDELAGLLTRPTRAEEELLATYLGEDRYHRMHERALRRNLRRTSRGPVGNVVVLHGIMGGTLTGTDRRGRRSLLWVAARRLLGSGGGLASLELDAEGLREARAGLSIEATGMLNRHYGELLLTLSENWRVQPFWFDWRKDLRLSSRALATTIARSFPAGEPVHLVAHSMGGLVARTFIADHPDLWNAMWDRDPASPGRRGGRLIMLGTPNHGSFDIVRVLAGNERLVTLLALADVRLSKSRLRTILGTFVGSYQMLPSPSAIRSTQRLYQAETYAPVQVSQAHLTTALEHHERLSTVVDPERMVYVAGSGERTYVGWDEKSSPLDDSSFERGLEGDGRVPHRLGLLAGDQGRVPAYYVAASHGDLTRHRHVLESLDGLLETGVTDILATKRPDIRQPPTEAELREQERAADEAAEREMLGLVRQLGIRGRSRGSIDRPEVVPAGPPDGTPVTDRERQLEELVVEGWLGRAGRLRDAGVADVTTRPDPPRITMVLRHGDIGVGHDVAAEAGPVVDAIAVGHYLGVKPRAAEEALDRAISPHYPEGGQSGPGEEGLLTQLTLRGTISGTLGHPFILPDPRDPTRILAIAGMDVPGRFGVGELTVVARELCWALGRLGRRHLASVLIGAGKGNLTPSRAVEAWVTGVAQALSGQLSEARLQRITLVEGDPRRLEEIDETLVAMRARLANERKLDLDYTGATVETRQEWRRRALERDVASAQRRWAPGAVAAHGQDPRPARLTITRDGDSFRFGAITHAAAVPEREIPLDPALVTEANDQLAAAPDAARSRRDGLYLGKLLFPSDLEPTLRGLPLVLMLDSTTARVHWELVARAPLGSGGDDGSDSLEAHLGIGAAVTRQLRTTFAPPPEPPPPPERRLRVLVVADPAEDAHLPGAEEEGILVADLFERYNTHEHPERVEVVRLFGPRAASRTAVLQALMTSRFHVLHFAGHCFYDKAYPPSSGWIFTDGAVLSARELRRIDRVPEFVFSNACESGVTPDRTGARSAALAPSFAESFFERGVGNFVCTAWPVDDQGARVFARTLYARLLGLDQGAPRPEAMFQAMQAARREVAGTAGGGARSWGAYQHYGDPLFRLVATDPTA